MLLVLLALALSVSALVACDTEKRSKKGDETSSGSTAESEKETTSSGTSNTESDFDYASINISDYVTVSREDYLDTRVTLSTQYIITDKTVDEYIEDQRFDDKVKTNGDTQVTDQPIKLGDSAFIYYTGYLDGVAFSGGSNATDSKPYELSIGSGSFIPGFEEGLIGIIPNTTSKDAPYDLHVTFPENYQSADLAGKAVVFKVWIEYTVQYTIPELNDDYIKNTIKYDGTVEEFKAYIKDELQASASAEAHSEAIGLVVSSLLENSTFHKYPQESITYWYNSYISQIQQYVDMYNAYGMQVTLEDMALQMLGLASGTDWKAELRKMATEVVENILVYYAIADHEGITVTYDEVLKEAEDIAKQYSTDKKKYTAEEVISLMSEKTIRQNVLMQKVDDFLLEECTIEYKDE